jgi:purine-binding chemotaxis protein CheW
MSVTGTQNRDSLRGGPAVIMADYVTMMVSGQLFGIPVLEVHDVFVPTKLAHVPMAPPEIAGVLNLRGRIVTAIDLRQKLGYTTRPEGEKCMAIVIEHFGEPYSLLVDSVGEVLRLEAALFEKNPSNLDPKLQEISEGIYRLDANLLVVLQLNKIIQSIDGAMAA